MVTVRDLLKLAGDVTELSVDLRKPDGKLIKSYLIGEELSYNRYSVANRVTRGELEIIEESINFHLRPKGKHGDFENGWGPDFKPIPKDVIDAEVTHFFQRENCYSLHSPTHKGSYLSCDAVPVQMSIDWEVPNEREDI